MEIPTILPPLEANYKMIDVGPKVDSHRRAVASGTFWAASDTIARIGLRTLPKGDVLALAEIAGVQGAKRTSETLPLCHPLNLSSIRVWTELTPQCIRVFCEVKAVGKTGVEMEALCGVSAALLCLYDLTKGIDPLLECGDIRLDIKEGGKSGSWMNPKSAFVSKGSDGSHSCAKKKSLEGVRTVLLTLSDRAASGKYVDQSGASLEKWVRSARGILVRKAILPDDAALLSQELALALDQDNADLIVTSGGTGVAERDITPETVKEVADIRHGRLIPGIGEFLRHRGSAFTPLSWLSRSAGFTIGNAVVICLPGNPSAVEQGISQLDELIPHLIHICRGGGH